MALIKPFKAWRPIPEKAKEIVSVPYDVISSEEAKGLAKNNPLSFLHIIRPEIDLPENTDIFSTEVYKKGASNLKNFLNSDYVIHEQTPCVYIYRLKWKDICKTGIYACVSTQEYDDNIILKHELTRPDKEDDRTRHLLTQQAHAEPVMLTFEDTNQISESIKKITATTPIYSENIEEVEHTIWKADDYNEITNKFLNIPQLYIADGHHRCASASRTAKEMSSQNPEHTGEEAYNFFPAVIFPMSEMKILAYNRVIFKLPDNFLNQLSSTFNLSPINYTEPKQKGEICLFIEGKWYSLVLPESQKNDVASQLDVARLQEFILEPFLKITNQRTDTNISFVGGIKGTTELEKLVNTGKVDLAISMYPTDIFELKSVSDANLLMPPKSTWFEPKLRSGFLVHTFGNK